MDLATKQIRETLDKHRAYAQTTFTQVVEDDIQTITMFMPLDGIGPKFFCPTFVKNDTFMGRPISGRFCFFIKADTVQHAFDNLLTQADELWEKELKSSLIKQMLQQ